MEVPKFRLLDKNKGNVIDSSKIMNINFENESIIVLDKILEEDNFTQKDYLEYAFKNVEFMQSIGLKDKNGKEIFEGDILDYKGRKALVRWHGSYASFIYRFVDEPHKRNAEWKPLYLAYMKCEIIGNIYENRELLEDKE